MTTLAWSRAPAEGPGRRSKLAHLCGRARLLPLLGRLRGLGPGDLRILAYHRVLESTEPDGFDFDPELISASAEEFHGQMSRVRRDWHPMRFDELADCIDRGRRVPARAVLVSFDDGYEDNHRIAFPVLRDLGLSAMFFVSTGHIEGGRPYAYDWLVHMVCATRASRLTLPALDIDEPLPDSIAGRRTIAAALVDRIKSLDAASQEREISALEQAWNMPRTQPHPTCRPMGWDQLREMRAAGMEVGSHGVSHRMLAKLPREEMRAEVAGSRATLQRELGGEIDVLSYPVGGPDAYDAAVVEAAREAGYRLGCSYIAGIAGATQAQRYGLRRLPVERGMALPWFEAMLALPEVFTYPSRLRTG